jgi:hypothetical protein
MSKVKDELALVKKAPILYISGVLVLAVVFELMIVILAPDRGASMNQQLQAKNALIIEKDGQINHLQDELIRLQKCIGDRDFTACI